MQGESADEKNDVKEREIKVDEDEQEGRWKHCHCTWRHAAMMMMGNAIENTYQDGIYDNQLSILHFKKEIHIGLNGILASQESATAGNSVPAKRAMSYCKKNPTDGNQWECQWYANHSGTS